MTDTPPPEEPSALDLVNRFLRAQNMEQVGRVDEAIELYESAVAAGFDSIGPYDRLIQLYADRALHREVVRVAEAALQNVRTYEDKRQWYERMRDAAEESATKLPRPSPRPE